MTPKTLNRYNSKCPEVKIFLNQDLFLTKCVRTMSCKRILLINVFLCDFSIKKVSASTCLWWCFVAGWGISFLKIIFFNHPMWQTNLFRQCLFTAYFIHIYMCLPLAHLSNYKYTNTNTNIYFLLVHKLGCNNSGYYTGQLLGLWIGCCWFSKIR